MPYRDPERKKEWERMHRPQRLARRRELRRVEAAKQTTPEVASKEDSEVPFLVPLVVGGALGAFSPELGMALGGLTLAIAAIYKKGWLWWIVGFVVLVVALFFFFKDQNADASRSVKRE